MRCANGINDSLNPIEYFYQSFVDEKHKFENKDFVQYKVFATLDVNKVTIYSKEKYHKQNLKRWENF